jgi:RNase P subunit RPR2
MAIATDMAKQETISSEGSSSESQPELFLNSPQLERLWTHYPQRLSDKALKALVLTYHNSAAGDEKRALHLQIYHDTGKRACPHCGSFSKGMNIGSKAVKEIQLDSWTWKCNTCGFKQQTPFPHRRTDGACLDCASTRFRYDQASQEWLCKVCHPPNDETEVVHH